VELRSLLPSQGLEEEGCGSKWGLYVDCGRVCACLLRLCQVPMVGLGVGWCLFVWVLAVVAAQQRHQRHQQQEQQSE
jgi:hypothetical protein